MTYFLLGILGILAGVCLSLLATAKLVRKLRDAIAILEQSESSHALLRARIRAVQDNGICLSRGERTYAIQKPNGRFGKFNLPEC